MNARRAAAIALTIAIVALAVLFARHRRPDELAHSTTAPPDAGHAITASPRPATDPIASTTPSARPFPTAPSRELIGKDARQAAIRWQSRAEEISSAMRTREYGEEAARLMLLPYDQAWPRLIERAKAGDTGAASAARLIASLCAMRDTENPPSPRELFRKLPDSWAPFLESVAALQRASRLGRVEHCEGVGVTKDVATGVVDGFPQPGELELQLMVASENKDDAQAIADLRQIASGSSEEMAQLTLGDRLMVSKDAAEHAEGIAMLERLAATDPFAAIRLGYCLKTGCGGIAPDVRAARSWLEQGAGLGDSNALSVLLAMLDESGDTTGAWAWSLYNLDLALNGCYETLYPTYVQLKAAVALEVRYQAMLTPAQQNAGLATYYAISGRWQKPARERLYCAN